MKVQTSDFKATWKGKTRRRPRKRGGKLTASDVSRIVDKKLEVKAEKKFYDDIANDDFLYTSTPVIVDICQPDQGVTQIERTGEQIDICNVFLRAGLFGNPSGINGLNYFDQQYRIMLIQWYPDSATADPTLGDLLQNSTRPFSWYERQNIGKNFRVLYDNKGLLSGSQGNPDAQVYIDVAIPGKRFGKVEFDGSGLAGTNHIYLVAFSNINTTNQAPKLNWSTHVTYCDL